MFPRTCLSSVPYPNQTSIPYYSKAPRQISKLSIYSYKISITLSEYNFTFNFCRVVIAKLVSRVRVRYGDKFSERGAFHLVLL